MARPRRDYSIDLQDFSSFNQKELARIVSSMAKAANARLRDVERADLTESSNAYKFVERRAFDSDKAFSMTKKGEIKFRTDQSKMTLNQLRHEAALLDDFLNSKTSTAAGTRAKYASIAETLNTKLAKGKELSGEEWGDIWRTSKKLIEEGNIASDQVVKLVKRLNIKQADVNQIIAFIEDASGKSLVEIEKQIDRLRRGNVREKLRHTTNTHYTEGVIDAEPEKFKPKKRGRPKKK